MPHNIKASNEQLIESYNKLHSVWKVANEFGMCGQNVWERLNKLGYTDKDKWTDEQLNTLRDYYSKDYTEPLNIHELEKLFGRDKTNICRKAKEIGLTTNRNRKRTKEVVSAMSNRMIEWHKTHEHPRGAYKIGKVTIVCKSCGKLFDKFPASKQLYCSRRCGSNHKQSNGLQGYAIIGKRPDLNNQYFRSRWEANYARYINYLVSTEGLIKSWEYEPQTFNFDKVRTKPFCYTPDFRITYNDGTIEYHEVKGWDYSNGKKARQRFKKYFPALKLILRDKSWFKSILNHGIDKLIPNWEYYKSNREIPINYDSFGVNSYMNRMVNTKNIISCKYCGKQFYRPPSQKRRAYCSVKCFLNSRHTTLKCRECGNEYTLLICEAKIRGGFCSRNCSSKYWAKHIPNGRIPQNRCIDCGKKVSRREYTRCGSCQIQYRRNHAKVIN